MWRSVTGGCPESPSVRQCQVSNMHAMRGADLLGSPLETQLIGNHGQDGVGPRPRLQSPGKLWKAMRKDGGFPEGLQVSRPLPGGVEATAGTVSLRVTGNRQLSVAGNTQHECHLTLRLESSRRSQ